MKIGIVSASAAMTEALRQGATLAEHEVDWSAPDAAQALECCARRAPDLVLVDLGMSDGVEITRRIILQTGCPVLVTAANVGADVTSAFRAMGFGAIDAVDAPPLGAGNWRVTALEFVAKLNAVAKRLARQRRRELDTQRTQPLKSRLVAIGASAGGPAALATLLGALPADFAAAIVIVQHVDMQFAPDMATWLNEYSRVPVRIAVEGDMPVAGSALLACTNDHLVFKSALRLGYTPHPRAQPYRPSVDAFLHSVDTHWTGTTVAVILTGMGRDGALGLKALRNKGCYTIAQDKATSAVYGMPQAAAKADAAVDVLPLSAIAPRLVDYFSPVFRNGV